MKYKEPVVQLVIAAAGIFFFIPFLGSAHLFDWDEINFAEAAREMLATHNFLQVQINFQPFWEKPPLFFWLQAASMSVFGVNEFAARLVDAVCGIATLLAVYRIGRSVFDRKFGLLWAGAFLGSFMPHLFFKSGIIDPVFNLFIFLGVYFIYRSESTDDGRRHAGTLALAGMFLGLATLTKGPVAILVPVLCAIVYWAAKRFRPYLSVSGTAVAALAAAMVALLWYGAETAAHGPWFVTRFVRYQIELLTSGAAGHGRPFWFHFVVLLFGCFPASFMAIRSFVPGKEDSDGRRRFTRWMIILFWVVLVLFSIVKTKTVLYSSLCYFPITFLAAYHMHAVMTGRLAWNRWLSASLLAFGLLVAAAVTAFPLVMMHTQWLIPLVRDRFARDCLTYPGQWHYAEMLIGAGYGAALVASVVLLGKKRFIAGFATLIVSTALCLQIAMIDFVPKMEYYTDAGPIKLFRDAAGKNVYAKALFKSYADLFYTKKKPGGNPRDYEEDWLLNGPIDKPAWFVCRIDKAWQYRNLRHLKETRAEYGYVYFERVRWIVAKRQSNTGLPSRR
jgi:hypothetical protein